MQIGMMGLGRMGANMVRRLLHDGHECVVYDINADQVDLLVAEGAVGAISVEDFVSKLRKPACAWVMLPAAVTGPNVDALAKLMTAGDIIIDGGNSHYHDAVDKAAELSAKGIDYVDVGTSGGVWGLERGYCLMIGGPARAIRLLDPVFATLAPGASEQTSPQSENYPTQQRGYLHCGPSGAGHFVKMIHNGIEYGMMAAYAEGMTIIKAAGSGLQKRSANAETSPLATPQYYKFDIDLAAVAEVWRHGSVISSWLLDLTAEALRQDPRLSDYSGRVSDSGEGRWTVNAAIDTGVPAPVLSAALFQRFSSQGGSEYGDKLLSAMRFAFGGHHEKSRDEP
ncbi:decarboxylating 6-phosphogluconate dehydrogenase [Phyllobacterium salinisoli]|uniref:Decarboxylating 6-phosphogluconate dehydrogenase n=1 Tax=Phyllobacterium salinisoli TaxID=1899321 RepID=A0A368K2L3_9HYPH|nr:decarboxylating 6-phosphogluconate dehydrogenase [Phyllobacterium salinisoli]RCS22875.1 decarboxylating 6-phosphogluconate dehydrogenase [Phyllobacterium salinisoli]